MQCFRHGESAANAGHTRDDPASIPLTDVGRQQAQAIADRFDIAPDRLISSPFLRAQQTAAPTRSRFRGIEFGLWPIYEFTYLSPARCAGTSVTQRRPWAQAYWDDADPQRVDGAGAESFATFIERVSATKTRLEQLEIAGLRSIALFGHGQFFQAFRWLVRTPRWSADTQAMRMFRELDVATPIANGSGFECAFDGRIWTTTNDRRSQLE